MYKYYFLYSCKKTVHPIFTKINRVRPTVTCNIRTKFEFNRIRLDTIVFTHMHTYVHTHTYVYIHTHIHTYIHASPLKIAYMDSGDLKICQNHLKVKFFFTITILSLHSISSESNTHLLIKILRKLFIKTKHLSEDYEYFVH